MNSSQGDIFANFPLSAACRELSAARRELSTARRELSTTRRELSALAAILTRLIGTYSRLTGTDFAPNFGLSGRNRKENGGIKGMCRARRYANYLEGGKNDEKHTKADRLTVDGGAWHWAERVDEWRGVAPDLAGHAGWWMERGVGRVCGRHRGRRRGTQRHR